MKKPKTLIEISPISDIFKVIKYRKEKGVSSKKMYISEDMLSIILNSYEAKLLYIYDKNGLINFFKDKIKIIIIKKSKPIFKNKRQLIRYFKHRILNQ